MKNGYGCFVRFGIYEVDGEEYKIESYSAVNGYYTLKNIKDKRDYKVLSITFL